MVQGNLQGVMDTKSQEIKDSMENGPYTIVVDLDGTLAEFDHWRGYTHIGNPIKKTVEYLKKKRACNNAKIILHTCRVTTVDNKIHESSLFFIRRWMIDNKIEHLIDEIWMGTGKPYGDVYLDDRAVNVRDI